jgi:hypothetical protein
VGEANKDCISDLEQGEGRDQNGQQQCFLFLRERDFVYHPSIRNLLQSLTTLLTGGHWYQKGVDVRTTKKMCGRAIDPLYALSHCINLLFLLHALRKRGSLAFIAHNPKQ